MLAHAGHTLASLAIYGGPILIVVAWLAIATLRDRRHGERGESRETDD